MKNLFRTLLCASLLFTTSLFASPVNINSASAEQIAQALNGVGAKKAEAIVAYRVQNGLFPSIDALLQVKGVGPSILLKNKTDILLK